MHRAAPVNVRALAVMLSSLSLLASGCVVAQRIRWRRDWLHPDLHHVMARSRWWAPEVPAVGAGFDVERYDLQQGGRVLFFRHSAPLEAAWTDVLTNLRTAGWEFVDHRASGRVWSVSACHPDCDARRFYAVARELRGTTVGVVVRVIEPGEFNRRVRLPGECVRVAIGHRDAGHRSASYMPIFSVDLDRDGRLDAFVPRPRPAQDVEVLAHGLEHGIAAISGGAVVWDAYVMRGACGHRVGTFDAVPDEEHFAPPGRRGLIDLRAPVFDKDEEGDVRRVSRAYWFDGQRYRVRRRDRR